MQAKSLSRLYETQPGTGGRYGMAFQIHNSDINGSSVSYALPGYSGPVAWVDFDRGLTGVLPMQSNTVNRTQHHQRIIDTIYRFFPARLGNPDGFNGERGLDVEAGLSRMVRPI